MKFRTTQICSAALSILLVTSCAQGIDDNERFDGGVKNSQLQSPELTAESFSTMTNPDGSENIKVSWPVVYGAGGYLCSVSIVDDPSNPVAVIADSIVDGCSLTFPKLEDTKYSVSVKTMGNEKLNNTGATEAAVMAYSTMIPAEVIPAGEEISQWVATHIASMVGDGEIGFELEAGKTYRLDGEADFGLVPVTFRGSKSNRPTVVVTNNGSLKIQSGFKLKWINFDCTDAESTGLIVLSDTPDESISTEALGYKDAGANQNGYVINDPVMLNEINVKGLKNSLIYGNKTNWSLRYLMIDNIFVQLNNDKSNGVINLYGASNGLIKEMRIENSTFYNLVPNDVAYFLRYSNSSNSQPKKIFGSGDDSTTHLISHCTFSKTFTGKDFANNLANTNTVKTTVEYCVFYDVFRLYQFIPTQSMSATQFNTIIGVTNATNATDVGGRKDKSGREYATEEDPQFVGPILNAMDLSQANGGVNFKPTAPYASSNKIGDPRWYE